MLIPRHLKRSAKLTDEERDEIYINQNELSQRALAKLYGVSRRLIQFIRFPEKHEQNMRRRKERGGSAIYYNRKKHTGSMRKHRRYKTQLYKEEKLEEKRYGKGTNSI